MSKNGRFWASKNNAKMDRYAFSSKKIWGFFCRSPYIKKTPNPDRGAVFVASGEVWHRACSGAGGAK